MLRVRVRVRIRVMVRVRGMASQLDFNQVLRLLRSNVVRVRVREGYNPSPNPSPNPNQVLRLLRSHGLRAFDPQAERRYFAKVKP